MVFCVLDFVATDSGKYAIRAMIQRICKHFFGSIYPKLCWFESLFMPAVTLQQYKLHFQLRFLVDTFYVCLLHSSRLCYIYFYLLALSRMLAFSLSLSLSFTLLYPPKNGFSRASLVKPFSIVFHPSSKMAFVHTVPFLFTTMQFIWTLQQSHIHVKVPHGKIAANMVGPESTLLFRNWNGCSTWLYVLLANFLPCGYLWNQCKRKTVFTACQTISNATANEMSALSFSESFVPYSRNTVQIIG